MNCQWISLVRQTKSVEVHLQTQEQYLALIAACDKTPAFSPNVMIQWIVNWGPLILCDEVTIV